MPCQIRRAELSEASTACDVVRRSIVELCGADHRGDAETLAEWLGNKTQAQFESWIRSDRHAAVVAELDSAVVGFGLLSLSGTIDLLYLAPEARFRGVSKAVLSALEQEALGAGIRELELESSVTALRFYERAGYARTAECVPGFGCTSCYPMSKKLADAQ